MSKPCNRCNKNERAVNSRWCRECQREYAKQRRDKVGKRETQHRMQTKKPTLKFQPKGTHKLNPVFTW